MTKEEYIKYLIKVSGNTVKGFAHSIHLPYTTLLGMLKNGLGGASVDNVIKVCRGLGITVEDLTRIEAGEEFIEPFYVNHHEKNLIISYRDMPEMQPAVDAILGIENPKSPKNKLK